MFKIKCTLHFETEETYLRVYFIQNSVNDMYAEFREKYTQQIVRQRCIFVVM
jgi:hypothetical protein